jgi:multicomponent Na+:H+ antiporter subunit G
MIERALDLATVAALAAGVFFFVAGTAGVLRFPDVYTRLHGVTKADNVGLGFVVLALLPQVDGALAAAKLCLAWLLVLVTSTTAAFLIARTTVREGVEPWRSR